jgi:hypothetical protein
MSTQKQKERLSVLVVAALGSDLAAAKQREHPKPPHQKELRHHKSYLT